MEGKVGKRGKNWNGEIVLREGREGGRDVKVFWSSGGDGEGKEVRNRGREANLGGLRGVSGGGMEGLRNIP